MNAKLFWPVLAIGLALIVLPLALSLPGRASAGERMIGDFEPIMQPANVETTADYYYDVFVPLGKITPLMSDQNVAKFERYLQGFGGVQGDTEKLVPMLAKSLNMTPAQVQAFMAAELPAMTRMLQGLPQLEKDFTGFIGAMRQNVGIFERVPAGLDHYEPLVTTMQGNVEDYDEVSSLPSFDLFTWFFIVPGVLLVLIAGWGLWSDRRARSAVPGAGRPVPTA